jgi:hypothetical protein
MLWLVGMRGTLTLFQLFWRWGWIFGKLGVWLSPTDVVKSLLKFQSPIDCIPNPYYIYTICFSTLICCGWAYVCTPDTPLGVGADFWEIVGMAEYKWCCKESLLRFQSPIDCIPNPYYIYPKCFSTLICYGWACGCTLTLMHLWR